MDSIIFMALLFQRLWYNTYFRRARVHCEGAAAGGRR